MLSVQKSQELERAALKDQETQLDKELQETEDQIASMKATIEQQKSAPCGYSPFFRSQLCLHFQGMALCQDVVNHLWAD